MNDQELKNIFKSMKHGEPSEIEVARWKKRVQNELKKRTPNEWARLAVACLIGVIIGAAAFKDHDHKPDSENLSADATFEMVHVNLD